MKNTILFLFTISFLISCTSDDSEGSNEIIINSIESSKHFAFIEEQIVLTIDAEGYTDIEVTSDNDVITINNTNSNTFSLQSNEAVKTTIEITLSNDNFTKTENLDYEFFEHGLIDFRIIEGLVLDEDSPERVREIHGDPDYIQTNENENEEIWYYFDKGFWILMDNNVDQAHYMRLYGIPWSRTFNDIEYNGLQYPYEISDGLKIENLQLSMTTVVDSFGLPTEKFTSTNSSQLHIYDYEDLEILFYFQSDDIDNYEGKSVGYVNIY